LNAAEKRVYISTKKIHKSQKNGGTGGLAHQKYPTVKNG